MKKYLITGGCGFIGSHAVRYLLKKHADSTVVNLDLLTYAGKEENVYDIDEKRHCFIRGDIGDAVLVRDLFAQYDFDCVINFAAETHVDNSIVGPNVFIRTNVLGTHTLLNCALNAWQDQKGFAAKKFIQISTDEVYGSLGSSGSSRESDILNPSNPYSASKASADLLALSYYKTYGMPIVITRCTNNYGPHQDVEKFIPLMITNAIQNKPLPVYGDGKNIRDWIYVDDHCAAVDLVAENGRCGEIYNIGTHNEWQNKTIAATILKKLDKPETLIELVTDRLGHDRRYSLDFSKIEQELHWVPQIDFETGLDQTILWYSSRI